METSSKGPIIIEFFGMPGCGKTTTAKALIASLTEDKYTCCNRYFRNRLYKSKFFQLFAPYNLPIIWRLSIDAIKKHNFIDSLPGILAICQFNQMYYHYSSLSGDRNVMILGQGVMQGFLSMAHTAELPRKECIINTLEKLKVGKARFVSIFCNLAPITSFSRLRGRRFQQGRLDRLSDTDLLNALIKQKDNADNLLSILKDSRTVEIIEIDTNKSVDSNVKIILERLCV